MNDVSYDYCVIGGGIVGLATAKALLARTPGASLLLLEKETELATHQTGHNSGVIHAGIYYPPGSLKADLCRRGAAATKLFASEQGIPFDVCGKLLVATDEVEMARMQALFERSAQNDLKVQRLDAAELREWEPHIRGLGALYVDTTGIIDYRLVCEAMGRVITAAGADVRLGSTVVGIAERGDSVRISTADAEFSAKKLVVCGGVQADRLARMAGLPIDFQMIPFRGEYYRLPATRNDLVHHLIYPIPDPELPFLGVHLTRMIDGGITVGPSAVLGFAREGYPKFSFAARDVREFATFPGMWHVARANVRTGAREMFNSLSKRGYLRECRKYCPELTVEDLLPEPAGIRAQAVLRDGTLVHDFLFEQTARSLHVCNAPSPAATSAIPIGEMIADRLVG
ncbi:L-2-hydroxyglutarate oxidase [Jatrophihabitans sp. GAS493]|nr:L-2-hydroxyglutarate oxidase [Jatrophihabitans sp. GAS493]SOD73367.1 L-2-hydroxyglutarate oxidase [Jatrophihabitans sp. GAS493]